MERDFHIEYGEHYQQEDVYGSLSNEEVIESYQNIKSNKCTGQYNGRNV